MVRRLIGTLFVCGLAAGCGGGGGPAAPAERESAVATFTNPVFPENFPDPGAILVDGTWYAYGTNNAAANVPMMTSADLVAWTPAGDALPQVGKWAQRGNTWAPEVIAADDGYLLYYTARSRATDRQCIGVARAHAWPPDAIGSVVPGRQLWLDRVDWVDGRPVVHGPTAGPQRMPH